MRPPIKAALAALVLAGGAALGWSVWPGANEAPAPAATASAQIPVGLFTSLPLLWNEGEVGDLLKSSEAPHWALAVLAAQGQAMPLDRLADAPGAAPLDRVTRLVLAQPRPLAPDENVALDAWVRGGGRLLLFADPMLTAESAYALGDLRRPQDVVLISPLLGHWGLELQFEEQQPGGERTVMAVGEAIPVNLAGQLRLKGGGGCQLLDAGLLAECTLGKGRALIVADAALLERGGDEQARAKALRALLGRAFR